MKRIVVINGHPNQESFNSVLAETYIEAAQKTGAEVRYIPIGQLDFDPNLRFGYQRRMELEPDLRQALEDINWSEHQVWIHPIWWLGMPAIMKGFFDRAFLPGIMFKRSKEGQSTGLLLGKTGRIIATAGDMSFEIYSDIYSSSGLVQLQQGILEYCGVASIQHTFIGPLQELDDEDRKKYLKSISDMALEDGM
ncbi:NAD(P)H-dependent oxidoreductase [Sphingobacterium tabacisoli]|uniref:NAD(P)H-dependent oxidoreductase n=1 Tax=Sphingobacterium tabacisoli TaxID=2044855 RepID=A0ABW5L4I5_9SPHI|nr:NAD(P)H-dependent oxidoreductase [Sphingobacterium tabacisoli]